MLRALNKARELLGQWGIRNHAMTMVLYAMLEEDWTFERSVQEYAAYSQCSPVTVLQEMQEAVEMITLCGSARMICEACYREAIR